MLGGRAWNPGLPSQLCRLGGLHFSSPSSLWQMEHLESSGFFLPGGWAQGAPEWALSLGSWQSRGAGGLHGGAVSRDMRADPDAAPVSLYNRSYCPCSREEETEALGGSRMGPKSHSWEV